MAPRSSTSNEVPRSHPRLPRTDIPFNPFSKKQPLRTRLIGFGLILLLTIAWSAPQLLSGALLGLGSVALCKALGFAPAGWIACLSCGVANPLLDSTALGFGEVIFPGEPLTGLTIALDLLPATRRSP